MSLQQLTEQMLSNPNDAVLQASWEALTHKISGQAVAEMEIEARRDAQENELDSKLDPYKRGTFESLCYQSECNNQRSK